MKVSKQGFTGEQIAKRMFFLAYQACGGPSGLGFLQARSGVTEDTVWENVKGAGDYTLNFGSTAQTPYADYVFGSMMKFGVKVFKDEVEYDADKPIRSDYQAWMGKYSSMRALANAAVASL